MRTIALLDHQSRWSVLRRLGNSTIAKATIAVPLVGYLLLFNGEIVKFLSLHIDFCLPASCGPSLRLLLLYLGCCLIAVGAALYGLRCPALIKKYDSAAAFFEAEKVYFCQPRNLDYLLKLIKLGTEAEPLGRNFTNFNYDGERRNIDPSGCFGFDGVGNYIDIIVPAIDCRLPDGGGNITGYFLVLHRQPPRDTDISACLPQNEPLISPRISPVSAFDNIAVLTVPTFPSRNHPHVHDGPDAPCSFR